MPGPDSTAKFSRQVAEATSPHIPRVSLRYQGSKFAKSRKLWFPSWSWKAVGIIEFIRLVFIIPASIVRSRKGTRKAPSSPLSSRLFLSLSSHALFIIVDCTCHREWNSISICLEFSEYRWMDGWMAGRGKMWNTLRDGKVFPLPCFLAEEGKGYWRWWGSAFFTLHGASLL